MQYAVEESPFGGGVAYALSLLTLWRLGSHRWSLRPGDVLDVNASERGGHVRLRIGAFEDHRRVDLHLNGPCSLLRQSCCRAGGSSNCWFILNGCSDRGSLLRRRYRLLWLSLRSS